MEVRINSAEVSHKTKANSCEECTKLSIKMSEKKIENISVMENNGQIREV